MPIHSSKQARIRDTDNPRLPVKSVMEAQMLNLLMVQLTGKHVSSFKEEVNSLFSKAMMNNENGSGNDTAVKPG